MFVIRDNDLDGHADWSAKVNSLSKVLPGSLLRVRWRETYSIGLGAKDFINYTRVPPGRYRYLIERLDLDGNPEGEVLSIDVKGPIN